MRTYRDMFRPNYDVATAGVWAGSALFLSASQPPLWWVGAPFALSLGALRVHQALELYRFRISLSVLRAETLPAGEILVRSRRERVPRDLDRRDQGALWLGSGFLWKQRHSEIAREILSRNPEELGTLPRWLPNSIVRHITPANSVLLKEDAIGVPWIHGMEPTEIPVRLPLDSLTGHTLIVGTTRAGKTRLYELMSTQIIDLPDSTLFVLDPKGDQDWERRLRSECKRAGRKFLYFHPAHPSKCIRINPLANWGNISEAATRLTNLIDADESFRSFAWKSLYRVMSGMVACGVRPNIKKVKRYIQMGVEPLLEQLLTQRFFAAEGPSWDRDLMSMAGGKPASRLELMIQKYTLETGNADECIDGLVAMVRHSKEHYSKMIQVLEPILEMLGSGELGAMLSPDAEDINDTRPIYDTAKMINERAVVYIALNSLPDKIIGSAIGSVFFADLASVAGAIYNTTGKANVYIMADESAELTNDQAIQILNKAGGAGFKAFMATQTEADFIVRLGSKEKARQMLGNLNNVICLRVKDYETAKWISESFGQTTARKQSTSYSNTSESSTAFTEFRGSTGRSMEETEAPFVSPDLLTRLPGLHYFAFLGGSTLYKGRLPLIAQ
ncbi:conjugative transfer system coupling protein TraD [Cupriavidus basilensis]|uniref:conjugative transfer system coupling protein TraD n=1 Tax=Cupriavidus basilensis TaxID=68895 RepID=UPI0039F6918F